MHVSSQVENPAPSRTRVLTSCVVTSYRVALLDVNPGAVVRAIDHQGAGGASAANRPSDSRPAAHKGAKPW